MLLASGGFAAWAGIIARSRRTVPGTLALAWLMFATAYWAVISALHTVVLSFDVRVALAQLQYIGIAPVAPLWLIFTGQYARSRWLTDRPLVALLWVVPVVTVVLAFTNAWHHLLWSDIRPVDGGLRLEYIHGPWFWVAVLYDYAALATGTVVVIRALRHFPVPVSAANGVHGVGGIAARPFQRGVRRATPSAGDRHHANRVRLVGRVVRVGLVPASLVRFGADRS